MSGESREPKSVEDNTAEPIESSMPLADQSRKKAERARLKDKNTPKEIEKTKGYLESLYNKDKKSVLGVQYGLKENKEALKDLGRSQVWLGKKILPGPLAGGAVTLKEIMFTPFRLIRGGWRTTKMLWKGLMDEINGKQGLFGGYWENAKKEFHLKKDEYGGFWRMVFNNPQKKESEKK